MNDAVVRVYIDSFPIPLYLIKESILLPTLIAKQKKIYVSYITKISKPNYSCSILKSTTKKLFEGDSIIIINYVHVVIKIHLELQLIWSSFHACNKSNTYNSLFMMQ